MTAGKIKRFVLPLQATPPSFLRASTAIDSDNGDTQLRAKARRALSSWLGRLRSIFEANNEEAWSVPMSIPRQLATLIAGMQQWTPSRHRPARRSRKFRTTCSRRSTVVALVRVHVGERCLRIEYGSAAGHTDRDNSKAAMSKEKNSIDRQIESCVQLNSGFLAEIYECVRAGSSSP